jgi:hypothetical protein
MRLFVGFKDILKWILEIKSWRCVLDWNYSSPLVVVEILLTQRLYNRKIVVPLNSHLQHMEYSLLAYLISMLYDEHAYLILMTVWFFESGVYGSFQLRAQGFHQYTSQRMLKVTGTSGGRSRAISCQIQQQQQNPLVWSFLHQTWQAICILGTP